MKMIQKMQQGGGIPPFVHYIATQKPAVPPSYIAKPTDSLSSEAVDFLDKAVVKMLYEKGLPSDVEVFLDKVTSLSSGLLSSPFSKSNSVTSYKALLKDLPKILMNKEEYNRAIDIAEKNDSIKETAIDSDGRVFVLNDEGKVLKKTISQIEDDENPLTVNLIAESRVYSTDLAFNSKAISTIADSVSITQINDKIQKIVKDLGTSTVVNEFYRSKTDKKVKDGIDQLLEEGADGVYKITSKTASSNPQVQYALSHIYGTLTLKLQVLLLDYARKAGMDLNKGPLKLILDLVQSGLDTTKELKVQYDKQATNGADTDEEGNKKTSKYDIPMMMLTGDGLQKEKVRISPSSNYAMEVNAQVLPFLPDYSGKPLPASSMANALLNSQISGILRKDAMHVGEQRIDISKLGQLYYDGSGVSAVELPYKYDDNGLPTPDLEMVNVFANVVKKIEKLGPNVSKDLVNQMFLDAGLDRYYNDDGTLNKNSFMRFAGISVVGDDETFKNPEDYPDVFTPIDDDRLETQIGASLGTAKNPMDLDDLYRAIMYIPLYDAPSLARAASGNFSWVLDNGAMLELAKELLLRNTQQKYNNSITKSDLLNGQ